MTPTEAASPPSPARPRLAAALAGAALALAHAGVTGAWWGPGQTPGWAGGALLAAAVVGAAAGVRGPIALGVAALAVAAVVAAVAGLAVASSTSLAPVAALVALGALAGDTLGRALSGAGARAVALSALAGAALLGALAGLPWSRGPRPDVALAVVALGLAAVAHRGAGALASRPLAAGLLAAATAGAAVVAALPGSGAPPSPDVLALRADVAAGRARVRFDARGAQVIDVREGERTARLLVADGEVRAVVPVEQDERRLLAAPVLEAALAHLLAPEAPRRLLVVGLDAGVSAGVALLDSAVEALKIVEPHAGVVLAHRDPGDLFGAINGRPLADARARLLEGAAWPALRARSPSDPDAPDVILAGACERPGDAAVARAATDGLVLVRLEPGPAGPDGKPTWERLRARLALLLPALGPDVLAFWPRPDAPLLLVSGAGALAPARVAARWQTSPALRERLLQLGLRRPADLLGLWIAGPTGLRAFAEEDGGGGDPYALARRAAESLPAALALPADKAERVAALVGLAEEAGSRRAPSAAAFGLAALREERTAETLRVLGDLLLQEGRHEEALARWREALTLDPAAVAPKVSMALLHQQRGEADLARDTLERALVGDATKDGPLRYVLGQLAMAEGDYAKARAHFLAAGALSDAADRAVLAGELQRRGVQPDRRLTPAQRVAAAKLRVTRAEEALASASPEGDAVAERERAAGVALLLELAADPAALSESERADVGRLLARCAAGEPLEPARAHLYRLAADVLAPLAADPVLAVERAVALHLGGRTDDAEAALRECLRGPGARVPRVHAALGDLLAATDRPQAAIDAYEQALALGPGSSSDARLYLAIAWLEQGLGRLDRAARALEAALRQAPDHPEVLANLGTVYRKQGRVGDALTAWRKFLAVVGSEHPMRGRIEAAVRQLER